MQSKNFLKKGDVLLIFAVALLAGLLLAFFYLGQQAATVCVIRQSQEIVAELPLDEDCVYTVEGDYQNVITIQDGVVTVTSSTCPNQYCVHSSAIDTAGQSIICLPNQLVVELVGDADAEVDVVVS